MADIEFDGSAVPMTGGGFARLLNGLGAVSSVALVIGLGFWGYQLMVRDVTGVPVIRALEGPARVQPEDPGGQLAQHQGLAVNRVQSEGEAEGPAPKVILAPPPIDLDASDLVAQTAPEVAPEPLPEAAAEPEAIAPPEGLALSEPTVEQPTEQEEIETAALDPLAPESLNAAIGDVLSSLRDTPSRIDPSINGVNRSPRPVLRPRFDVSQLRSEQATSADLPVVLASASATQDLSEIAAGTRLVQLGSFEDRASALAEWERVSQRLSEYFEGRAPVIQQATTTGGSFFRLRVAGFADMHEARQFCAAVSVKAGDCIPVIAR